MGYPNNCSIILNFYIPKVLLGLEAKKYFWVVSFFYFTAHGVLQVHRSEGPFFGKSKQKNQEIMPVLVYVSQVVSKYCHGSWEATKVETVFSLFNVVYSFF